MSRYIPYEVRQLVAERANSSCEYCLMPEIHSFFAFHIDHIISIKHGGLTEPNNLAYTCPYCNRNKGSDIASILPPDNEIVRLFNPRSDAWLEHFQYDGARVRPLSNVGKVTLKILDLNQSDRIAERQILIDSGRHTF